MKLIRDYLLIFIIVWILVWIHELTHHGVIIKIDGISHKYELETK